MNSRTKRILLLISVFLVIALTASLLMWYQIQSHGSKLLAQIEVLRERAAQEANYSRIITQIEDSTDERSVIDSYFFENEGDSVSFLSEIEALAIQNQLLIETVGLDKITAADGQAELIKITFSYRGTREQVMTFTRLLESVPYHSVIESVSLRAIGNQWEGRSTILITIQPRV